mgnify:CR=1 FL=1
MGGGMGLPPGLSGFGKKPHVRCRNPLRFGIFRYYKALTPYNTGLMSGNTSTFLPRCLVLWLMSMPCRPVRTRPYNDRKPPAQAFADHLPLLALQCE